MGNLFHLLVKRHRMFLGLSLLLLGGFEFLLCGIVASVDLGGALQEIMKSVPTTLRSIVSEQFAGWTRQGILAFGWNHPIAHALGTAVAIVLAARSLVGEIEKGVLELILSHPISRATYLVGQGIFGLLSLIGLSITGVLGTVLGQSVYGVDVFGAGALGKLALNFFLLQTVWYGCALVFSVVGRESVKVATAAFITAIVSYFINVVAKLWPAASFLLPYSLHTYYSPQAILVENTMDASAIFVLCTVSAACFSFTFWRFQSRDIP